MRVLVVEDEKGLAESMRRGLVAEGFVVDVVHDGVSGLWAASEFSYDVAILDIMLPRLNGYDVLKHIRDRNIWTPVIMLTARTANMIKPTPLISAPTTISASRSASRYW
jgi:DNA-binding response OmpR family regulator